MTSLDRDDGVAPGPHHFEATLAASDASTHAGPSSGRRVLSKRPPGLTANRTTEQPRPARQP